MIAIGFFNNKGGVGKTTLMCNIAAFLSLERQKRVLVIDADPQANASQLMIGDDELDSLYAKKGTFTIHSIAHPLSLGKGFANKFEPYKSNNFGVDIVLGDPKLALVEDVLAQDWGQAKGGDVRGLRTTFMFRHILRYCEDYDYVIFDMGPSLGSINRSVLIGCDYFVLPMSIDIFSLRASENISAWMSKWKKDLLRGVEDLDDDDIDSLEGISMDWKLSMAGYVTQQYNTKTDSSGNRRAVKSYDKIIKQVPDKIKSSLLSGDPESGTNIDYSLGTVPHLFSLVPMSQSSHKPIFTLKAVDGIVGSHFTKVKESYQFFRSVTDRLSSNLSELEK